MNALARNAAAALLNAADNNIDYPQSEQQANDMVRAAIRPGGDIAGVTALLESYNPMGDS